MITEINNSKLIKPLNPSTHKLSESERSWCIPIEKIQAKNYDIKAVNPNKKVNGDLRTQEKLLATIESHNKESLNVVNILQNKGL